jgi:hypothetical protein
VHFINHLPPELTADRLAELDWALGLSASRNAEIARAWFIQVAERRYEPAYGALEEHLKRNGRTRLIEPVYAALVRNGADGALASRLFEEARGAYHPITVQAVGRLFTGD